MGEKDEKNTETSASKAQSTEMNSGDVINRETAEKAVSGWLDHKRIKERKREEFKDQIKTLVEAVMDGTLQFNDDHTITQPLIFPLENDQHTVILDKLTYQPRIKVHEVHARLKKSDNDADSRIMCYVCCLTGQGSAMLGKLDSSDYSICNSIAVFFL